jgi:hypothetical protein
MPDFSAQDVDQMLAKLKREHAALWESMKEVMRAPFEDNDEQMTRTLRALHALFNELPFITTSPEPDMERLRFLQGVNLVAAAEVKAESSKP